MKASLSLAAVAAILAGCSTSPQALEKESSTRTRTRSYAENYQAVYKRIVDPARRCSEGGFLFSPQASMQVDAQLYTELGFGEVTYSLINVGARNYYWKAKVAKSGAGTNVTVYSGNTLNNTTWLNKVLSWADGGTDC